MEKEKKKKSELLKKWAPISGLVLLTVVLMIYFKESNIGFVSIQNAGRDLIAEYTSNLIPVYSKTELTNEDLVNFAFYENLPVDKENNTVLQIKSDEFGKERIFVKEAAINPKSNNYERFVKKLNLNKREVAAFDSILNVYRENLYTWVLYNDKNSLAVDLNLPILHKAMSTDIYEFLKNRVNEKSEKRLPENYATLNRDKIQNVLEQSKSVPEKEYIVIAPDTAFQYNFNFEGEDYFAALDETDAGSIPEPDDIPEVEVSDAARPSQIDITRPIIKIQNEDIGRNFNHFNVDSNYYVVEIPEGHFWLDGETNYDSLRISLENLETELNEISINFNFNSEGSFNMDFSDFSNLDSLRTFNLEFNLQNLDTYIEKTIEAVNRYDGSDWEKFGLTMDSLARNSELIKFDSLVLIRIKEQADSIRHEARRHRKD